MSDKLSLYGITEQFNALEDLLDQDLELSQGEITEEHDQVKEQLGKEIATLMESKLDGCVGYAEASADFIKLVKEKKKDLDLFMKAKQKKLDNFKDYIGLCLERSGEAKLVGELKSIKFRKAAQQVEITDADKIPVEFTTVETLISIKKAEIKAALKAGTEVPGAKLVDGKKGLIMGLNKGK